MADEAVVFRVLHLQRLRIGHRHRGGLGREFAVGGGTLAGYVMHAARSRGAFGFGHIPSLRRRADQHLPALRAELPHGLPVDRRRGAAAGNLQTVLRRVQIALLDAHVLPISVELFGNQHGQHDLDALADLGILGDDSDDAIGRNGDKGSGQERNGRPELSGEHFFHRLNVIGQHHAATGDYRSAEK